MKTFNISASCDPELHYMVNIDQRLSQIKTMIDKGQYFTISRARQYGKTTTLQALEQFLKDDYLVISLDFQLLSSEDFKNEHTFTEAFSQELLDAVPDRNILPAKTVRQLTAFASAEEKTARLSGLFRCLSQWCRMSGQKIVLIIDEADSAADHQVFFDFLSQLRGYYIQRKKKPSFHSVILSSVYDIRNMKQKNAEDDPGRVNSPWNIAVDFLADMSFSPQDISGMLEEYEHDHNTGMNTDEIAGLLYDYTSGYPFLVSRLCKFMDEQIPAVSGYNADSAWTAEGVKESVRLLLTEKNTLFDSLIGKLLQYSQLKSLLYSFLFYGQNIAYSPYDSLIDMAVMFGFVKIEKEQAVIACRIFETILYNYFLTTAEMQNTGLYKTALQNKNQFICHGHLNMRLILEKFVIHFHDLYGEQSETFLEEDGRRYFLLYLKPIINGTGNYYIESRTRNMERTDVIVDYHGEQFIIELKIWRGNAYHTRGEQQLADYLEYYHLDKGYLLRFNFNKKKKPGVHEIKLGNRLLIEAVV